MSVTELPGNDADARPDEIEPDDDASEIRTAAVGLAQHGERLDKLLTTIAPEFSRNHLQGLVADGHVQVEGRVARTASTRVKAGQRVQVELVRPAHELAFTPEAIPLHIVHEDAHVLVLHKPAGLVVHPAAGNWSGTLLNGLLAHGRLELAQETIDAPIGRDPRVRVRMAVVATGKPARTDVEELAFAEGIAAVRCTLHTGRTHQIRVHLAHRGHPLVADEVYGGRPALGMTRQALHAAHLAFRHPVSGAALAFDAPPPPDFARAWAHVVGE